MFNPGSIIGDEEKHHDHDKKIFTAQLKQSLIITNDMMNYDHD